MYNKYLNYIIKNINTISKKIISTDRNYKTKDIDFNAGGIAFTVDINDKGGAQYLNKVAYEEINDPLYSEINNIFNPSLVLDIGANYGITGVNFAKKFPNSHVILIEPDKKLGSYINKNLNQNNLTNFSIIGAMCGDINTDKHDFFLNPNSSQDNRVKAPNPSWQKCITSSISLDTILLTTEHDLRFVFIKIDTQGYESNIINGAGKFLDNYSKWIIKMEFAPHWLMAHGIEPACFLKSLIYRFHVVELPSRTRFKGDNLKNVLTNRLAIDEVNNFLQYIQSLNMNKMGWCDLLILPNSLYNSST